MLKDERDHVISMKILRIFCDACCTPKFYSKACKKDIFQTPPQ